MRELYEYRKIREVMEEYSPKTPKTKMAAIRSSFKHIPTKDRSRIPVSPSEKDLLDNASDDIARQAVSKNLKVNLSSLEIYRNEITKKVKLLDVKISFSYQENFVTQTERLEMQLVRHGKKWTWLNDDGSKNVITFPYLPGDRVNLNVGLFIHKTKKHGLFGKETITTQAGTAAECIVLAKNNGAGMGLPMGMSLTHNIKLNFDINGRGHSLTLKLRLDLKSESKGPPIMWLRPMSADRRFRSPKTALDLLLELPPKDKNEDGRVKVYVYNHQRLVNYQRSPVLECRSVRPAVSETEIPTGIEVRTVLGNRQLAYLVPVIKTIDKELSRYRLAIIVVTADGPYCMCSAKWKSADKFDYKIHMYKTGETFGQRIKWASKDFVDISYTILNSTGHQIIMRTDSDTPIEDICIGLCLKSLVRWCNEPLPWKQKDASEMSDALKYSTAQYRNHTNRISEFSNASGINAEMEMLPAFLLSQELCVFSDVEEFLCDDDKFDEFAKPVIIRTRSGETYDECDSAQHLGDHLNIEQEEDDDGDTATVSSKPKWDFGEWADDGTTSGFLDGRSEFTGGGSWIDSVM